MQVSSGRHGGAGAMRRLGCVGVAVLLACLVATTACTSSTPDEPDVSDSELAAALLTEADVGEQFTEAARVTKKAAYETDWVIDTSTTYSSDDPDCQELFDRLADTAEDQQPDVSVLFMGDESNPGSIHEDIRVGPVEQALADEQAFLDCAQDGFTVQIDNPGEEPGRMAFVSTPLDIEVPGWDVVASTTRSPAGEGETVSVIAGRDGLLVSLHVTAESVPVAQVRQLTTTALQRADTELLDAP